jgi:hypothetical protein
MTEQIRRRRPGAADTVYLALAAAFIGLRLFNVPPWDQSVDAYAYWQPLNGDSPYAGAAVGLEGSYLYSPAFKLLMLPFSLLPWPVFNALWTTLNIALLRAVAGPLALPLLLFVPVPFEIVSGNVHLLLAAVAAWGLTRPALWAIPLLTKVSPGIGVLWHAVRGEWRPLGLALGVTAVLAAVSFLLVPGWWSDWLSVLGGESVPANTPGWFVPVAPWVRLPAAAVLLAWGARTGRRWTIPVAMVLAMPVIWLNSLAVLVAVVPLVRWAASASRRDPEIPPSPVGGSADADGPQ